MLLFNLLKSNYKWVTPEVIEYKVIVGGGRAYRYRWLHTHTHICCSRTHTSISTSASTQADGWVGQRKGEKEIKSIKYM